MRGLILAVATSLLLSGCYYKSAGYDEEWAGSHVDANILSFSTIGFDADGPTGIVVLINASRNPGHPAGQVCCDGGRTLGFEWGFRASHVNQTPNGQDLTNERGMTGEYDTSAWPTWEQAADHQFRGTIVRPRGQRILPRDSADRSLFLNISEVFVARPNLDRYSTRGFEDSATMSIEDPDLDFSAGQIGSMFGGTLIQIAANVSGAATVPIYAAGAKMVLDPPNSTATSTCRFPWTKIEILDHRTECVGEFTGTRGSRTQVEVTFLDQQEKPIQVKIIDVQFEKDDH